MFDERSGKWIYFYRGLTIALFWLFIAFGILAGIGDFSGEFLDIDIGGDTFFWDFIVWVLACGFVGFIQLVTNMLIIQFFNNVQIIREKIESR